LFDSKYRVSTMDGKDASPRDAIDEMHRYRDAILYRRGDGSLQQPNREAIGAYVIFPGRSGDKSYEYAEKRAVENIGAIPLLPGANGEAKLVGFIKEIIAKRTAGDHLSKDIPTRGTTVVVGEGFGEADVVDKKVYGNDWNSAINSETVEISKDELGGREPKSIQFVRFVCPLHSPLMAKVWRHSSSGQGEDAKYVFSVKRTPPD